MPTSKSSLDKRDVYYRKGKSDGTCCRDVNGDRPLSYLPPPDCPGLLGIALTSKDIELDPLTSSCI